MKQVSVRPSTMSKTNTVQLNIKDRELIDVNQLKRKKINGLIYVQNNRQKQIWYVATNDNN